MSEKPFIAVSKVVDAPPERVWAALTSPESLKRFFFGADVETSWKVGTSIRFRGEMKGKPYEDHGEIRSFAPGERLAFSHFSPLTGQADTLEHYNLVAFDLEPAGGERTKVTLSQDKLAGEPSESDVKQKDAFTQNWRSVLDGLAQVVAH